jgi:hypothetical protein
MCGCTHAYMHSSSPSPHALSSHFPSNIHVDTPGQLDGNQRGKKRSGAHSDSNSPSVEGINIPASQVSLMPFLYLKKRQRTIW